MFIVAFAFSKKKRKNREDEDLKKKEIRFIGRPPNVVAAPLSEYCFVFCFVFSFSKEVE